MKKLIISSFVLLSLIAACKKDSNSTTGGLNLNTSTIAGRYTTTDAYVTLSGGLSGDIYDTAFSKDCQKFSINTFTAGGSYIFFDSCTKKTDTSAYGIVSPNLLYYHNKQYVVQSLTSTKLVIGFDSIIPVFGSANFKLTLTRIP
jgi:hypothetical protein